MEPHPQWCSMSKTAAQSNRPSNRRHFLTSAAAVAFGAVSARVSKSADGPAVPASPANPPAGQFDAKRTPVMRIGILSGTFGRPTLEATLDAVKASGLDCAQLSLDCAGLPAMPDRIPAELADRVHREAATRGVAIVSIQGTFNMSHPEAEHRRVGLRRLQVLASSCQRMGTSKIHLCSGTRDRDNMWRRHPDNDSPEAWRDMVGCVREAVAIAEQAGVTLALEPEVSNVVDSARKARRLLDEIRSPHLRITMDAANLFHAGELPRMGAIMDEAFALLGKDIVLAHAKDLDHDGEAGHLAAGHGRLDYERYLSLLHACGFNGPLLLHGLAQSQVTGCVAFLREKLARVGPAPSKAGAGPG
jgi:sugar phosphate isomerase/epimerase